MKKKKHQKPKRNATQSFVRVSAIRSFTKQPAATYCGEDLFCLMRHIRARLAFADEPPENTLVVFFKQVAVILGKTYAERGDAAQLADDLALMMIRDLLLDLDAEIIDLHRDKKLPPCPRAV
jgi:hypothetical protein